MCDLGSISIIRVCWYSNVCLLLKNRNWVHRELSSLVQRDRDRVYTWIPLCTSIYGFEWKMFRDGASEEQGLLLLIVDGCSRVSAFGFVQSQNELVWMNVWRCDIRSELLLYVKKVIVTSGLINREMTKTGQAAGLSGSRPLGYIITDLENRFVPLVCFGMKRLLLAQP